MFIVSDRFFMEELIFANSFVSNSLLKLHQVENNGKWLNLNMKMLEEKCQMDSSHEVQVKNLMQVGH